MNVNARTEPVSNNALSETCSVQMPLGFSPTNAASGVAGRNRAGVGRSRAGDRLDRRRGLVVEHCLAEVVAAVERATRPVGQRHRRAAGRRQGDRPGRRPRCDRVPRSCAPAADEHAEPSNWKSRSAMAPVTPLTMNGIVHARGANCRESLLRGPVCARSSAVHRRAARGHAERERLRTVEPVRVAGGERELGRESAGGSVRARLKVNGVMFFGRLAVGADVRDRPTSRVQCDARGRGRAPRARRAPSRHRC